MDILFAGLLLLAAPGAYFAISRAVYLLMAEKIGVRDEGISLFGAVFWPLTISAMFFWYLPEMIAKSFSWLGRKAKSSEGMLAPGIPKPSHVLEGLVAARVLQNYQKIQRSYGHCQYYEGEIRVDANVMDGAVYGVVFRVKGERFEAISKGPLVDALKRAMVLKREHEKNAELAKQENSALNAIEFLTIGESDHD